MVLLLAAGDLGMANCDRRLIADDDDAVAIAQASL